MTWKQLLTSTLGRKYVMALTGFFLIIYLIVHATINALIFYDDGGVIFNSAAHFMSHNIVLKILEILLFAGFIIHIIQGLMVWKQNRAARPVKYQKRTKYTKDEVSQYPHKTKITWYSRYMGILGSLILLFLVMHLSQFFMATKNEMYFNGREVNLYEKMKVIFTNPIWFSLYMVGLASLLFHLFHGFQSAFQTMGINHKRWLPIIRAAGYTYSVVICLLFASMPISFMAGWLK